MDLQALYAFLGKDWTAVQERLHAALRSDIDLINQTNDKLLSGGGKRLRPMLVLLAARACGAAANSATHAYAAASELLHNGTLLHDDVADNSASRHGAPTVQSLLGGRASVLLGDFWLVKAMEEILSEKGHSDEVIRLFAKTLSDLAEGELLQLEKAASGDTTLEDYLRIIYCKTASLFVSSAQSAAVSVDAPEWMRQALTEYSTNLGIAFQIRDDMFDYSDGSQIGKPVGIDLSEQKITLPLLGALSAMGPEREADVRRMVRSLDSHPREVEALRAEVVRLGGLDYSARMLSEYVRAAVEALSPLPPTKEKDWLVQLAGYVGERTV